MASRKSKLDYKYTSWNGDWYPSYTSKNYIHVVLDKIRKFDTNTIRSKRIGSHGKILRIGKYKDEPYGSMHALSVLIPADGKHETDELSGIMDLINAKTLSNQRRDNDSLEGIRFFKGVELFSNINILTMIGWIGLLIKLRKKN